MAVVQNSKEQISYRYYTPTGGTSPSKNVKVIEVPSTSVISQIIDGVLNFFTGEFNLLDFIGRLSAVLFESIIYDFKEDPPIDPNDWERVNDNVEYNKNRGYTNIKVEFLGLIEGYHTWKLSGYSSSGNYAVWYIPGYIKYQTSKAIIEETVDKALAEINKIDWFDWSIDPFVGVSISRLNLIDKITAQAKEHGLI